MRLTKPEKKAVLAALEWLTGYHDDMCALLDPAPEGYPGGGYHLQGACEKLRAEVQLTPDERLERDSAAHNWERDRSEH